MTGSYYAAYIVKNQTDSNTYNNFQTECFLKCRFTIDVLQKVKKEVTNSESCVTVKLLHQKSNKEAIRQ